MHASSPATRQIYSAFECEAPHGSFTTPTGSILVLELIWIDELPAMSLLAVQVQLANVAGEEARQVLNEIDFSFLRLPQLLLCTNPA